MMHATIPTTLQQIIGLIRDHADPDVLARGRERQAAVAENRQPDYLPIIFAVNNSPRLAALTEHAYDEEFYHLEKMLENQLNGLLGPILARCDGQLTVRANMGTPFLATAFGLQPRILSHTLPWMTEHLDRASFRRLDVAEILDDLPRRGLFPRALEYYDYAREVLGTTGLNGLVHTYLPDTQSAFDLAHLVVGHELFTDLYDEPEFVAALVAACTELYCRATHLFKDYLGEPRDRAYHGSGMYMASAGVRCCEDSSTLVSPAAIRRYIRPATETIGREFGGVFVHFCGKNRGLLDTMLEVETVRCINFGNPENYDFPALLPELIRRGKYYHGSIPRQPEEHVEAYFSRVVSYLGGQRRGLAFAPALDEPITEARAAEIVGIWHDVQDRCLN